jgi:hypothetical protein
MKQAQQERMEQSPELGRFFYTRCRNVLALVPGPNRLAGKPCTVCLRRRLSPAIARASASGTESRPC